MNTPTVSTAKYSVQTLEDTPRRALELLRGIGSSPAILRLMSKAGYTTQVHEEGQRLLAKVISFVEERQAFRATTSASHMEANDELVTWTKTVLRRLKAAVTRLFPERADALFANLEVSNDVDASLVAKIFLDRISAFEGEPKGKAGGGHAIIKMLAERGFGHKEIRALRKLVDTVQSPASEPPTAVEEETTAKREERLAMLAELRAWYDDWSETARTVLVRRDHAIRVGIAHRKARATPVPPPVVVDTANGTKAA